MTTRPSTCRGNSNMVTQRSASSPNQEKRCYYTGNEGQRYSGSLRNRWYWMVSTNNKSLFGGASGFMGLGRSDLSNQCYIWRIFFLLIKLQLQAHWLWEPAGNLEGKDAFTITYKFQD
ncbi:hypothetical protein GmHk_13G039668 [Glycine max]|nr:hypothetical protein GmHk_13G039668 [Glycine max]KAH1219591.1 hypothetical protein GmHk_13G039668 [Glycine max]